MRFDIGQKVKLNETHCSLREGQLVTITDVECNEYTENYTVMAAYGSTHLVPEYLLENVQEENYEGLQDQINELKKEMKDLKKRLGNI